MDEENKKEFNELFKGLESEISEKAKPFEEEVYIVERYSKKLMKRQNFFTKMGIPRNLFWGIVIGVFVVSFFFLVVWPMYRNFSDLSFLLSELEELENTYYSVNSLARAIDTVLGNLKEKSDVDSLLDILGIENKPGVYENISLKGPAENVREVLEELLNNPRILLNELQLRSNLSFPVMPKTALPTSVVLELNLSIELTNLF
ncbi:hypothetical protein [Kosmotoga pacifica]|uniref:Uncharacterized protein n=2 Tax=Kosmotoga pacifica TaxID=1330330 RepID=A0A0G2ZGJ8_9BACT|nr:hypothetical protein [Kosmotoga pacifica]AKI97923.1 hypothetical protein IX53_08935 [Kosmotoga pacifica]